MSASAADGKCRSISHASHYNEQGTTTTRVMPSEQYMHDRRSTRGWSAGLLSLTLIVALLGCGEARADQPPANAPALFRIFLKDGTALASYGEFARVGERVIFSLPLGTGREQLASVGAGEIDWARTDSYSHAVRAAHYAATRGEADYAKMSAHVAELLTEIAQMSDLPEQVKLAGEARRLLVEWPKDHFGYKADEVRQTLGVLDEVIAGLRSRAGQGSFDLSLVSGAAPPPAVPLLDPPSLQESITQALRLATLADSPAERIALLRDVQVVLDDPAWASATTSAAAAVSGAETGSALPESWRTLTREKVRDALAGEARTDRDYASLVSSALASADRKVARADVRGLTDLRGDLQKRDERLGRKRPEQMQALLATLDQRLDAARRLRLARDQWALKSTAFRAYQKSVKPSMDLLTRGERLLNDIRALAGPSLDTLTRFETRLDSARPALRSVEVPADLRDAHASLVSAWQMTEAAIRQRKRAIVENKIAVAWDASAAAAGALMLFDHARTELARMMKAPEIP